MHESFESSEELDSLEGIRKHLSLERWEGVGIDEVLDSTAEKLIGNIKDGLELADTVVQKLAQYVQESWEQNRENLPTELRAVVKEIDEWLQAASEVIQELAAWLEQNSEKCEAAVKVLLLIPLGFENRDGLLDFLRSNPGYLQGVFDCLSR
jgi:hypothetical protein